MGAVGLPAASMLLNIDVSTQRHHRVQRPDAVWNFKRQRRDDRAEGDDGVLERADPQGVFPTQLSRIWRNDDVIPGDPVKHLHIIQVPVDRVCINPVVGDLPDLGAIIARGDRGHFDVRPWAGWWRR